MSKTKKPGMLDWTAPHGPAWAAINAAGVSATIATAGYLADAPLYTGAAQGLVGAVASLTVSTARRYSGGHRAYRCAAWLAGGGWTSWAMAAGPWSSWWPALALGAGTILAWGCNAAWAEWETEAPERRREAELRARREQRAGDWIDRLERVCRISGATVVGVETWAEDAGYTVEIDLPPGPTTVDDVARYTDSLRADLRLPHGCTLEVTRGVTHGSALIAVNTVNLLARLLPYPAADTAPRTVKGPLNVGKNRDATPAFGILRSHCGLIIGQPEGGKTNLINVINAELARCPDALIWHIDTTGAGITLPWLRAWAIDGTASRPVVDWSASTVDEALAMLRVAEQVIAQRKRGYQQRMFEVNDDKVPVGADLPAIIIIADEVAQLPMSVQAGMDTVNNTGRAVAVRSVNCALRGTRDMVSASQKEMTRWRIGMRVSDASEYQHLFSQYQNIDPEDAQEQGSGFMEWDGGKPRPFKAYRILPEDISTIANRVSDIRPVMDEISLQIDDSAVYRDRWARTLPALFDAKIPLAPAARALLSDAPTPVPSADAAPVGPSTDPGGLDMEKLFPMSVPKDYEPEPRKAPEKTGSGPADPEFTRVMDDAMWHMDRTPPEWPAAPAGEPRPTLAPVPVQSPHGLTDPAQIRALELLAEARTDGLGATRLEELLRAEGYTTTRQTAQEWLARWLTRGWLAKLRRDGGRVAYVLSEHADAAPGERVA
ncbi:hypothetical protein ACFXCZ_35470 [Streptomyces sp. NPDC059396]|uniref:hypothetical protein n=1 Tax=Streptomyces sp. NPDC059396 TaxID=3346819 RepID=UPI0036C45CF9